jgi:PAS domain S-box-containing protein
MPSGHDFEDVVRENVPDAIIGTSLDGLVVFWGNGAERIFGYNPGEALGQGITDLLVPADQVASFRERFTETIKTSLVTYDAVRRRKDGSLIHVDVTAQAVRHATGELRAVVSAEKDVTQLKVLRDAKHLATRFRDLFELMPDAIVVLNATGRIVLANQQAETLFGYPSGSLIGHPVETLLPERLRPAHVGHRSGYVAQPRVRSMGVGLELHGLRSDGTEIPVEISLSPLQTDEGMMVMSAIRDSTERKRFEKALREKNEQLATAMQAKDRFLTTMSHELRTPLNAILGFTGTLLMRLPGPLNDDQERQLKTVQRSGRHLLSLINDLLDLARIEADKLELEASPTVCQDVLNDVCSALQPQAAQKGLAFGLDLPVEPVMAVTDRRAFMQIVTNLVANAVKFCDQGDVRVSLAAGEEDGTGVVRIVVADTGIGIKAEHLPTVFDAFSRFESESGPREGSGLGLHLSRRLAEVLGGRIDLSSEVGRGSTFTLTLPRERP